MPSSSCLCKVHSEFFNAFNSNLIKMWSSAKKFSEYRHLACYDDRLSSKALSFKKRLRYQKYCKLQMFLFLATSFFKHITTQKI